MDVITVSGHLGTGARDVALLLASDLGFDYVDQSLLVEAARQLGVPVDRVADRDERTQSFGERLSAILRSLLERSAAAGAGDPMSGAAGLEMMFARTYEEHDPETGAPRGREADISDKRYVDALSTVIRQLAARGRVVIVGRGSHAVLQHEPRALHVNVIASLEFRQRTIAERDGLDAAAAKQAAERAARGRQSYHRQLFRCDADDPAMYGLTLNAGSLSPDAMMRTIRAAATATTVAAV